MQDRQVAAQAAQLEAQARQEAKAEKASPKKMAGSTRLELAPSGVTGRRSNQLNYDTAVVW